MKNIDRPVRVYALRPEAVADLAAPNMLPPPPISQPTVAPRLSIVVLPFANLSDDPEQQYFADGITEDLTTDLSRIADMLVISSNTAFTYKDRRVDTRRCHSERAHRRRGARCRRRPSLLRAIMGTHPITEGEIRCARSTWPLTLCASSLRGDAAKACSASASPRARSAAGKSLMLPITRARSVIANHLCTSTDRGSRANARSKILIASTRFLRDGGFEREARPRSI